MKKIISALLILAVISAFFAGCGSQSARVLYNVKLSKYVDLGDYNGIKVDTSSDDYKTYYEKVISSDVENKGLYVKKTEGTVANDDTANIDYEGKKDGVAFEGGTAQGYDLKIGSNSFIEGFETGIVGKEIGSTFDLNLTFPESYGNAELAGKPVVFTVKVNYVTSTEAREPSDFYSEFKFKTLKDYEADVKERAIKQYLVDKVVKASKTKSYPDADVDVMYNATKTQYESYYKNNYNMSFADVLSQSGTTEDAFKEDVLKNTVKPSMDTQMVLYAIADKEKIKFSQTDSDAKLKEMAAEYENVDTNTMKEYFGDYYFESEVVNDKVSDYLYKNAKIK